MRTMAAWMLAGVSVALLTGCEDQSKTAPVIQTAPPQTTTMMPSTATPYPGDANMQYGTAVTPPPAPPENTMTDGSPPPSPIMEAEPEPVDTAAPPPAKPARKARKATTENKSNASQGPKESYPRKEKASRTYTVKRGDTLQEISQKYYGTTTKWRQIYKANEKKIGANPDKLMEGAKLNIP